MSYFPMFIELKDKKCLVVGGGSVALRKAEALKEFGADVLVTAPVILPELAAAPGIRCQKKHFEEEDLTGMELVIAATDDAELNHRISILCRREKIPVNAADQIKDCSFIFPAYQKEGEVVAAFSSGGQSPVIAQYLKEQIHSILTPRLGELSCCLGSIRKMVQQGTKTEQERKIIYQTILQLGLAQDAIPDENEILEVIKKYSSL